MKKEEIEIFDFKQYGRIAIVLTQKLFDQILLAGVKVKYRTLRKEKVTREKSKGQGHRLRTQKRRSKK